MIRQTIQRGLKTTFRLALWAGALSLVVLVGPRVVAHLQGEPRIFAPPAAPGAPVAIVFGAGLLRDGSPGLVLRDRVATAADLYDAGKVQKILLSGDNRFVEYNEPQAMYEYGLALGLPGPAMVLDYAGRRTYDTCLRARDIFGITKALLITQNYHLDRALLTCASLGLSVHGVSADRHTYSRRAFAFWWLREFPATTQAMWDLYVAPPADVVLGEPEPIVFN